MKDKFLVMIFFIFPTNLSFSQKIDDLLQREPQKIEGSSYGRVSDRFLARLGKAQQLMVKEKFQRSMELISKLEKSIKNNKFAKSQIFQTKAYLFVQQNKYDEAIAQFQKVISLRALPISAMVNSYYALAQVLSSQERYFEAVPLMQDYLVSKDPPRADAFFFFGQILTQLKKLDEAIFYVEKANKISRRPNKTWLALEASLYFESKQYQKSTSSLRKIIEITPKDKKYWIQLSNVHLFANQDMKALSVLISAYRFGLLTEEKEIIKMVRLALYVDIPYKAAQFVKESFAEGRLKRDASNLELLSDSLYAARETEESIAILREATKLANNPVKFLKLGQRLSTSERWDEAFTAYSTSLKLPNTDDFNRTLAQFSLGIAAYRTKRVDFALSTFNRVTKSKFYGKRAKRWIKYIESN